MEAPGRREFGLSIESREVTVAKAEPVGKRLVWVEVGKTAQNAVKLSGQT